MKRLLLPMAMSAALVLLFALPNFAAQNGPDNVQLKYFPKKTVVFNHSSHGKDCKVCHHKWDGAAKIQSCAVAGCHDNVTDKKLKTGLYQAIHNKKAKNPLSCLACHKKKAGKDKAKKKMLTGCSKSKCHP